MRTRRVTFVLLLVLSLSLAFPQSAPAPVSVIFDTDMGNDIDDTLALAILHSLASRGEARLLAVTTTKDNPQVAPAIDILDRFYGRPDIPVGVVKNGKTPENSPMLAATVERKNSDGSLTYRRAIQRGSDAPDAVDVLRRVLAAQSDASVVLVQVGFSTNLARLLDRDPDLVRHKVKRLVAMAGNFHGGEAEYNVKTDIPAAQKLFDNWPTEIVCSGYEVGESILYPARSIEHDFAYVPHHPVADAYRAYEKMPYDRPTWDLTAALYAVRPEDGYFNLSSPGSIHVDGDGKTAFTPSSGGHHRFLTVTEAQKTHLVEAFRELASQPPPSVH